MTKTKLKKDAKKMVKKKSWVPTPREQCAALIIVCKQNPSSKSMGTGRMLARKRYLCCQIHLNTLVSPI